MLNYSSARLLDLAHAVVLDLDGRILFWTGGAQRMYGWSSAEAVGQLAHELLRTESPVPLEEVRATLLRDGEWQGELSHIRKDGSRIVVASHRALHCDEHDAPAAILEVGNDVTAVKRAEEVFRLAVESAPNALVMVDAGGRVALVNSQAEAMFGYTREELTGRPIEVLVPERFRPPHPDYRRGFFASAHARPMGAGRDLYGLRKDGREIPVEIGLNPLETAEGTFVLASIIDITERRGAEERFRLAVESAPNAMVMADEAGRIVLANSQAERLFGYAREELIGQRVEMLVPERFRADHPDYRRSFSASPQVRAMGAGRDLYGLRKDGTEVPVEIGLNPIRTEKGRLVLSSIVDITERKRAEAERERLLSLEQEARTRAEEANRLKDEFLATVSHELRTPLTSILGYSSMLRTGMIAPEDSARAIETIERNARAQAQIVNDILEVSRIITGKLRLEIRQVRPAEAVEAAIAAVRPAVEAKGIRLVSSLDLYAGPVMGDPDRLQQVAWNLLSNAVKFTPPGGRVEVRLEEADSHVRLVVRDTGVGITPEFLPYVFDRFRQADSSRTRSFGGLGLGLAIVRYLVELHGGTIAAESGGEGRGATFTVTLPLAAFSDLATAHTSDPERESVKAPAPQEEKGGHASLAGLRVLVVEDEADTRQMIGMVLEGCGAEVRTASRAREAFEAYKAWRPDVMVCDIGMPEEDGYAFIQWVRAAERGRARRTPAVALTGYARAEDREQALTAGYQVHLPKPVDTADLVAAVAGLTRHSPEERAGGSTRG